MEMVGDQAEGMAVVSHYQPGHCSIKLISLSGGLPGREQPTRFQRGGGGPHGLLRSPGEHAPWGARRMAVPLALHR